MIRSFRERPLLMFGMAAFGSFSLAVVFVVASAIALITFRDVKASALVLPGASLLWFGLGFYLLMLGLIGEVVLREERAASPTSIPVAWEVRS
jgi:hypothetical protein